MRGDNGCSTGDRDRLILWGNCVVKGLGRQCMSEVDVNLYCNHGGGRPPYPSLRTLCVMHFSLFLVECVQKSKCWNYLKGASQP